jgi:tRNA threonylcarbamoyladenosine biosynthesis protein TsaB
LALVEEAVKHRVEFDLSGIDGYIAARGPGSFTGIRIGISMIKGLALAMGKPCAGVSSLDGIAFRFCHTAWPVCVMMDARRGEVYTACYWFDSGVLVRKSDEQVCSPEQAVGLAGPETVFAGSGARAYHRMIQDLTRGKGVIAAASMDYVSAAGLVQASFLSDNFFDRPENRLVPVYLRKSDAQIQWAKKQVH